MATYVLVAGAGWGGFIWRPVATRLRERKHEVFTPTLTGLGERVHLASPAIDLETHILDIVGVLEYEDLHETMLVGHSYGGVIITGVAERVPQRLAHLIYLDAIVPRDGQSDLDVLDPAFVAQIKERADTLGEGWRIPPTPEASPKMTAQPLKPLTQPLSVKNPTAARLPHTFIACTQSTLPSVKRVAERVKAEGWRYEEVATGHMAMLTAPEALVLLASAHRPPGSRGSRLTSRAQPGVRDPCLRTHTPSEPRCTWLTWPGFREKRPS